METVIIEQEDINQEVRRAKRCLRELRGKAVKIGEKRDGVEDIERRVNTKQETNTGLDEEVIQVQLKKKYRAALYDIHDQQYATHMKLHNIPKAFNDFTDGLMDETHINRYSFLQAIDDYNKTEESETYPLELRFQDAAFNYRPYQPCIIS
jgi:DNA polymerase sigma